MNVLSGTVKSPFHLALYGLWLLMPLVPMVSPVAVSYGLPAQLAAWLPLVLAFLVVPLLQVALPGALPTLQADSVLARSWRLYLDVLVFTSVPLQLLMLIISVKFWASGLLGPVGSVAYLLGVGSYSGFCAINVGHELLHSHVVPSHGSANNNGFLTLSAERGYFVSKLLASVLLAAVCFGTFLSVHLRMHHLNVGTDKDHYTARRGQSIYAFLAQAFIGNFKSSFLLERDHLRSRNRAIWDSPVVMPSLLSLVFAVAFFQGWGFGGLVFFFGQSIVAIILLDWINYLQHYGITRRMDLNGRIEPFREWHAWNESSWISDIYLLNLFRHVDHHLNPSKPFYLLKTSTAAPVYPYPYAVMMPLSLIPGLFFSIANRILDAHPLLSESAKQSRI